MGCIFCSGNWYDSPRLSAARDPPGGVPSPTSSSCISILVLAAVCCPSDCPCSLLPCPWKPLLLASLAPGGLCCWRLLGAPAAERSCSQRSLLLAPSLRDVFAAGSSRSLAPGGSCCWQFLLPEGSAAGRSRGPLLLKAFAPGGPCFSLPCSGRSSLLEALVPSPGGVPAAERSHFWRFLLLAPSPLEAPAAGNSCSRQFLLLAPLLRAVPAAGSSRSRQSLLLAPSGWLCPAAPSSSPLRTASPRPC